MTNHDRLVSVFKNRSGQTFSTAKIVTIMLEESDISPGTILPNDHADGNAESCWCANNHLNQPILQRRRGHRIVEVHPTTGAERSHRSKAETLRLDAEIAAEPQNQDEKGADAGTNGHSAFSLAIRFGRDASFRVGDRPQEPFRAN
jgi:hypothetical protein